METQSKRGLSHLSTGATPAKLLCATSNVDNRNLSTLSTSFSALRTTSLLPPVTTKFPTSSSTLTTNRLLQSSSSLLSHQNTGSDLLKETNLAAKRRDQLFSTLLSEKPNLSNRLLTSTTRLSSNLISKRETAKPTTTIEPVREITGQVSFESFKPTTTLSNVTAPKPQTSITQTRPEVVPVKPYVQPRQIVLDLAPEPIIEFVRSEDEESEALEVIGRGWNKSSSSDTKEQLSLLRAKEQLLLEAAVSLVGNPRLESPDDPTRQQLIRVAETVAEKDPEFILKIVLYCRQELNLRSTSNLLLAFACLHKSCKIHVLRYFKNSVVLPTDWMSIADFIQTFHQMAVGSLPAVLRKAMVAKFIDFDEYQLAKYNKGTKKKKPNTAAVAEDPNPADGMEVDEGEVAEEDEEDRRHQDSMRGRAFNLKRLIKVLHISEPVYHVLCLLGKNYPSTEIEFMSSRLPGNFEPSRAGKRLKLPTPETWETKLAKLGNTAEVWHDLIDNKKLPYMAAIRNLRNLVLSGIDDAHVQKVCQFITNEKMVAGSRLFPFRFFTAYDILDDLEKFSSSHFVLKHAHKAKRLRKEEMEYKKSNRLLQKQQKMNAKAIEAFRKALDKAVKIATIRNIPPIKGVTIILCSTGLEMTQQFGNSSAAKRSLNKSAKLCDAALLLSLMCQSSAEDAELWTYNAFKGTLVPKKEVDEDGEKKETTDRSLLARVKKLIQEIDNNDLGNSSVVVSLLSPSTEKPGPLVQLLRQKTWIDNLVWIHGEKQGEDSSKLDEWTAMYRQLVNPALAFISVDVDGSGRRVDEDREVRHPKDLRLSGFGEQIFQCLSSPSGSQVDEVENVDKKYKLPFNASLVGEDQALPDPTQELGSIKWRRVRVFISSTFLDMHGERDLLNRFVFPELSRRCRQHCLDILPIDLRWGLPHFGDDAGSGELAAVRQVRACIDEIDRCHFFLGFLGQRYGWKPPLADIGRSNHVEARALWKKIGHVYKPGMSITELEMCYAALGSSPTSRRDRVFFFLRDPSGLDSQVPSEFGHHFNSDSKEDSERLSALKEKILQSGYEVVNNYPVTFRGLVGGTPMTGGLAPVGQRVLDILSNSVTKLTEGEQEMTEREKQEALCSQKASAFVGRQRHLDNLLKLIHGCDGGVVHVSGPPGSGLTSLLCKTYKTISHHQKVHNKSSTILIPCFVDALSGSEESNDVTSMIIYIFQQLMRSMGLAGTTSDTETLAIKSTRSLNTNIANLIQSSKAIMTNPNAKVILFVDGLENLKMDQDLTAKNNVASLDWLPQAVPAGVVIVVSTHQGNKWERFFMARQDAKNRLKLVQLDVAERKEILRDFLSERGKALDERAFSNDLSQLASKREAGNVKYLKLLADEMSMFGFYDELGLQLARVGETSDKILQQVLARLEDDFGPELVSDTLALLFISRHHGGLSEQHLKMGLSSLTDRSYHTNGSVSPLQVSMLLSGLDAFLKPTRSGLSEGMLLLKENDHSLCIEERYWKKNDAQLNQMHTVLGDLFCQLYTDHHEAGLVDPVILKSLLFHLSARLRVKEIEEIACTLDFVFHSAVSGTLSAMKMHLSGVYLSSRAVKSRFLAQDSVKAFADFLLKHGDTLASQPCLTLQLALNEEPKSLIWKDATKIVQNKNGCPIMMRSAQILMTWENRCKVKDASLKSIRRFLTPSTLNISAIEATPSIEDQNLLAAHGFSDGSILVTLANTNDDLFSLIGHASPITALAFLSGSKSSGDAYLVSGSHDGTLSFWDLNTRIRLSSVKAHGKRIAGLASSLDGLTVVSVGYDGALKVWGGRTRKEVTEIKQDVPFTCVAHHPDKDFVITGGFDGLVKIWDLTKVERRAVLRGHKSSVQCVSLSWDAKNIASSSITGDIIIFDGSTGSKRAILHAGQCIYSLSFLSSEDGSVLAGCRDGEIIKWKFDNTSPILNFDCCEEPKRVTALNIDNLSRIAVGLDNGELIWNAQNEKKFKLQVCNEAITNISSFERDCRLFTDVLQTSWSEMLDDEDFDSPKVTVVIFCTETRVFSFAVLTEGDEYNLKMFVELEGFEETILSTSLVGSTFITASRKGSLYMHQMKLYQSSAKTISIDKPENITPTYEHSAHKMSMKAFAAHPTRDWCITAATNLIKLWEVNSFSSCFARIGSIKLDSMPISLTFTVRYGKSYIMACTDSKLYLCHISETQDEPMDTGDVNVKPKKTIQIVPSSDHDISQGDVTLHSPARGSDVTDIIACVTMNGIVIRSNKGAELRRFEGNFGNAVSLAHIGASEDCYQLTVWDSNEREILVYDVLQGELDRSARFAGFSGAVNAVTSLGNDKSVFGSSRDKTLRIWKPEDVRSIHAEKPEVDDSIVSLVTVGSNVLSLSEDGTLLEWSSDENGAWNSNLLTTVNCTGICRNEKMASLAAVMLPSQEQGEKYPTYILAASCSRHLKVNLLIHSLQRTSTINVQDNDVSKKHFSCLESPPLSSAMAIEKQSANEVWLHLIVGFESGDVKEYKFALNKKKTTDSDFIRNPILDTFVTRVKRGQAKWISNVYFFKTKGQSIPNFGYAGKGGTKLAAMNRQWLTCSAVLKVPTSKRMFHIFGDVDGYVHIMEVNPDEGDMKGWYEIEKLHGSEIVALTVIEDNLLASASKDGFVRLWRCDFESNPVNVRQVGEFSGRGLPLVTMAPAAVGKKTPHDLPCIFASDKFGVYILPLHL